MIGNLNNVEFILPENDHILNELLNQGLQDFVCRFALFLDDCRMCGEMVCVMVNERVLFLVLLSLI